MRTYRPWSEEERRAYKERKKKRREKEQAEDTPERRRALAEQLAALTEDHGFKRPDVESLVKWPASTLKGMIRTRRRMGSRYSRGM